VVSARFHNGVAAATANSCAELAEARGLGAVVLSGGVFQNRLLLERTAAPLEAAGLEVLVPRRLPPNDGGISYGQAAVAAARLGTPLHGDHP
jgi:hydrogenase maturation protein HypF